MPYVVSINSLESKNRGGRGGGPLKYPEESDGLVTGQKKNKRVLSSGACGMSQY